MALSGVAHALTTDRASIHVAYGDVVGRTQVYLGREELELLDRAAAETGASRSELIRRAIRKTFGGQSQEARLDALRRSAGSWKRRSFSGSEYVDTLRGDLNERLRRIGLE